MIDKMISHGFRHIQEDTGWTAVSLQYPSTRQPIVNLAEGVALEVKELVSLGGHDGVWAVTHSLGGIVQRHIMGLPEQGRLVQHGCQCLLFAPVSTFSSSQHGIVFK